ncbi:MAG: hypothetical protein WBD53_18355 [Xanthobacteraceae bacterium]
MRILAIALALALTAVSSHAQGVGGVGGMGGGFGGRHQGRAKTAKAETPKQKVDDKAYKDALKSIPDKPFDAWNGVR